MQPSYPDISDILAAKARRRQTLAALSWEEKVAIVEQMRQLLPKGSWKNKTADKKALDLEQPTRRSRSVDPN
jgi:hypothetical protein